MELQSYIITTYQATISNSIVMCITIAFCCLLTDNVRDTVQIMPSPGRIEH